jgi:hypothetical protein
MDSEVDLDDDVIIILLNNRLKISILYQHILN